MICFLQIVCPFWLRLKLFTALVFYKCLCHTALVKTNRGKDFLKRFERWKLCKRVQSPTWYWVDQFMQTTFSGSLHFHFSMETEQNNLHRNLKLFGSFSLIFPRNPVKKLSRSCSKILSLEKDSLICSSGFNDKGASYWVCYNKMQ